MEKENDKPEQISYQTLKKITNDFSDEQILGRGTFGVVYRGENEDGHDIAVKLLNSLEAVDDDEFLRELNSLTNLSHKHIVQLVGFCNETETDTGEFEGKTVSALRIHRALCFEYMYNGSLKKFLSDEYHGFGWHKRYRIIKGICEGLKYLHEELDEPIYHLDLKPDNILLDKDMVPKIADFGLSKLLGKESTRKTIMDVGTRGYVPPEYLKNQTISTEFDIFSLGVIIIKIITGPTGHSLTGDIEPAKFVEEVCNKWRKRLQKISDYKLLETDCKQVKKCIEIALKCIENEQGTRPTVGNVVDQLKETEEHQNYTVFSTEGFDDREFITTNIDIPARHSSEMGIDPTGDKSPGNNQRFTGTIPHELPLEYLKKITNGFSEKRKISEAAFGSFYKGILEDGRVIIVKKLGENAALSSNHFFKVAIYLMSVQHENILKLLSCCSAETKQEVVEHKGKYIFVDTDKYLLCYEYAPEGSLRDYLSDDTMGYDWTTQFKIIKGICLGLYFLHKGMDCPIVHLDLQPANILLHHNKVPKIADFGLARLFAQEQSRINTVNVVGAVGYMAPEYLYSGEISPQCDMYSLGVLIIQITTRGKNRSDQKDMSARNFIATIRETWTDEHIASVYSSLDPDNIQEVKTCIEIGLQCVDVAQKNRPSIVEIIDRLNRRRGT